jgi:hypothetical protein
MQSGQLNLVGLLPPRSVFSESFNAMREVCASAYTALGRAPGSKQFAAPSHLPGDVRSRGGQLMAPFCFWYVNSKEKK